MSDETALIDAWEQDGVACREIRSHRAPSRHTRLKAATCVVVAGVVLGLGSVMLGDTEAIQGSARSFRVETYVPPVIRAPEKVSRGIARTPFDERLTVSRTTVRRQWVLPSSKAPTLCWGDMDGDELNVGLDFPGDGKATGGGVVVKVGRNDRLGLSAIIDHQDGTMSVYSGVQRVVVREGSSVVPGQRVVTGGFQFSVSLASSADSATDHLVNPVPWLNERVRRGIVCSTID